MMKLLDIVTTFSEEDRPADFNLRIAGIGGRGIRGTSYDHWMQTTHRPDFRPNLMSNRSPPVVALHAVWTGVSLLDCDDDAERKRRVAEGAAWLRDLAAAFAPFQRQTYSDSLLQAALWALGTSRAHSPMPITKFARTCCGMMSPREHALPYVRFDTAVMRDDLRARGFPEWAARKTFEVQRQEQEKGLHFVVDLRPWGGSKSALVTNAGDAAPDAALSWRRSSMLVMIDAFHEVNQTAGDRTVPWPESRAAAQQWLAGVHATAFGPDTALVPGKAAVLGPERRFIYSPHGADANLDDTHALYFETEAAYERVLATKRRVDPRHVFTPNEFCVGFNDLAADDPKRVVMRPVK
jgi:hypothetical protein